MACVEGRAGTHGAAPVLPPRHGAPLGSSAGTPSLLDLHLSAAPPRARAVLLGPNKLFPFTEQLYLPGSSAGPPDEQPCLASPVGVTSQDEYSIFVFAF